MRILILKALPLTISGYLDSAIHFGGWLGAQGASFLDIDEKTVKGV
jgi:hypothetical protein